MAKSYIDIKLHVYETKSLPIQAVPKQTWITSTSIEGQATGISPVNNPYELHKEAEVYLKRLFDWDFHVQNNG